MNKRSAGRSRRAGLRALLFASTVLGATGSALAATISVQSVEELSRLSIEDLANVQIISVFKRPESLSQAPAAIFVITNDDIRRSGATTLPEALRLAPNLQVARESARSYAITARGFNGLETSNKILVMIDGRSVYTPLHSGVFWDALNVMLDDVERIEVVSGPGGTLWGANAVNGVINVITRHSAETQGGLVSGQVGAGDRGANARFGGKFGRNGSYRVYGLGADRDNSVSGSGDSLRDDFQVRQAGFRTDWSAAGDAFTLQGDTYDNPLEGGGVFAGTNVVGRWNRALPDGSGVEVQSYYDRAERRSTLVSDRLETIDLQAQHVQAPGQRHGLVWGGGIRFTQDEFINRENAFVLSPEAREVQLANLFVQDSLKLSDDLTLTFGTKLEHSSYSGLEHLPSARLGWRLGDTAFLWSAVSRAVRTPSRIDRELIAPGFLVAGGMEPERLWSYEIGYRGQPLPQASLSISFYYNQYDDLRTIALSPAGGLPLRIGNGMEGETYGVEIWGDYRPRPWWRLGAGINLMRKSFREKPGSTDLGRLESAGNDPSAQFSLRSNMDLSDSVELTLALRAVDDLPNPRVRGYLEADARLGWWVTSTLDLSLTGYNLLDDHHPESGAASERGEVSRTVLLGARWKF